jgi:hypothetical protein
MSSTDTHQWMIDVAAEAKTIADTYPVDVRPFVQSLMLTGGLTAKTNGDRIDFSSWAFSSYEQLVLDLGHVKVGQWPLTNDQVGVMTVKECFTNAYQIAMRYPDRYWYTEGYAQYSFLAVNHAWLTEKRTGRIIDPTWVSLESKDGPTPIYAGIRFSLELLTRRTLQTGYMGILTEDWQVNAAALRYGFRIKDGIAVSGRIK